MVRLPILAGTCLALAAGAYGVSERKPEATDAAYQTEMNVAPAPMQSVMPEYAQAPGTVCETPNGSVCTVPPAPINSRCQCSGSYGVIVR